MCSPLGTPAHICILAELLSTGVTQNNVNFVNFKWCVCVGGKGRESSTKMVQMEREAGWSDSRAIHFQGSFPDEHVWSVNVNSSAFFELQSKVTA